MSRATTISGWTFFLTSICIPFATNHVLRGLLVDVWSVSIPVLFIAVAVDLYRKRYWALLVLAGMLFVIGFAYLVLSAAASQITG
ncbi:MAG TPA: hypothetical protein VF379_09075 [Gaiellaceae bacterium]